METETLPFGKKSVPRYTFLGNTGTTRKLKLRRFHCCFSAALLALLLIAIIVILSFYLNVDSSSTKMLNDSQSLDSLLKRNWPLQEEHYPNEQILNSTYEKRALESGINGLKVKDMLENILPSIPVDSPSFRHQLTTATSKEAQKLSEFGYVSDLATKWLNNRTKCNTSKKPRRWLVSPSAKWVPADILKNVTLDCLPSPYRRADGTCNNLKQKNWGAALTPFRRILLPAYEDGVSTPRGGLYTSVLPSARKISTTVHKPVYTNDVNFTVMLAVWGQFIDHDITATAISKGKNGAAISCCHNQNEMLGEQHPECFPVYIDSSDSFYKQFNVTCMEFVRSSPAFLNTFGPREQLNQVTSFLDGSVVYGSNDELMDELRTYENGELKMFKTPVGELLPVSTDPNDGCNRQREFDRGRYCFLSGDARSNENLLLTSMHLIFAREHNRVARELQRINPKWEDEKIFQEARKIVSAQIQRITYNEFLPSILPQKLLNHLNMTTKDFGYSNHYNSSVNPTIANSFASAAFRFGHTLIPELLKFWRNESLSEYLQLHKMLFNPFKLFKTKFLENSLKGALTTQAEKADVHFNKELTDHLFQKGKKNVCGLDLVSLNIQRGRDHGLPSYPDWSPVCGFQRPNSFDDLKGIFDDDSLKILRDLYRSVNDLDLYTGALAEIPVKGGLIGRTFTCLIADQFLRLKIGDRFWYETDEEPQKFTLDQLNEIRKISLAKIICKNSGVEKSQVFAMRKPELDNKLISCDQLEYPDFEAWREN